MLVLRERTERPEAVEAGTAKVIGVTGTALVSEVDRLLGDEAAYRAHGHGAQPVRRRPRLRAHRGCPARISRSQLNAVWLVLPAFNEERSLPALLERCVPVAGDLARGGHALRVIVVDDGSSDGTIAAAQSFQDRLSVEVVPHGVNRGLGAALRTGLGAGLEHAADGDTIATMDADNTHDPALLGRMIDKLEAGADVVIASRYEPGGAEIGLTPIRRVLSRGASFLLTMVLPVPGARDYTCGFRLYRAAMLRRGGRRMGRSLGGRGGLHLHGGGAAQARARRGARGRGAAHPALRPQGGGEQDEGRAARSRATSRCRRGYGADGCRESFEDGGPMRSALAGMA